MDPCRFLLVTFGAFLLGMTLVVAARHFHAWRTGGGGLLPLHIWTIAGSYDLLLLLVVTRTGPLGWRGWVQFPAVVLGVWAMLAMLRFQGERKNPPN